MEINVLFGFVIFLVILFSFLHVNFRDTLDFSSSPNWLYAHSFLTLKDNIGTVVKCM